MEFTGKKILILPSQGWGKMFISKHHYAITLAEMGNTVFYLNPPDDRLNESVSIDQSAVNKNLYIISHKLWFPYNIKFHLLSVFHWLMSIQIKKIQALIGMPDIVWSFDIEYLYPFKYFRGSCLKIFHPVDEPLKQIAIDAARGADVIFSVTKEILAKYSCLDIPSCFINHGVANNFLEQNCIQNEVNKKIKVGISGNFLRGDVDRDIMLKIIDNNPDVEFHLWGSYEIKESNIGGTADDKQKEFIQQLVSFENTTLYGAVSAGELARNYCYMDAFLICYDIEKDQSKGTNYHKIMEYLAFGKVIISNNVSTYNSRPELVMMCKSRSSNGTLPELFRSVIANLSIYNSPELMKERKSFARDNSYDKQVKRIEKFVNSLALKS